MIVPRNTLTDITLTGSGFLKTSDLFCKFDKLYGRAAYVSSSTVTCTSPFVGINSTSVDITTNFADFTNSGLVLFFVDSIQLFYIIPSIVIAENDHSQKITIIGANFIDSHNIVIFLGTKYRAQGIWTSSSKVICALPLLREGNYSVSIIHNINSSSTNVPVLTVRSPAKMYLYPNTGPTQGRTNVTISGSFLKATSRLRCLFEDSNVAAKMITTSLISCLTPSHTQNTVQVHVLDDDVIFSDNQNLTFSFFVLHRASIYSIMPSSGPVRGNTAVTILGDIP
jgi:hypothetical protein